MRAISARLGVKRMAVSLQTRRMKDGTKYFTATVRVTPYPSASKTFSTRNDAIRWARDNEAELKRQAERREARADLPRMTVADLVREFLADPETQRLASYRHLTDYLAWWQARCGADRVMEMNVTKLREARDVLRKGGKKGRSPATVNRYLSGLRSAWNWGRAAGLIPQERAWPDRVLFTEPEGRVRYLDDDELAATLNAAAQHSDSMHTAILVSLGCGVRRGELLRLKWSDIDLDKQQLQVRKAKNSKADGESRSRSIYIPTFVVDALRRLRRAVVVGQHVITDADGQSVDRHWLSYHWRVTRKCAGLKGFRWHDLRHSCASFLAQNGATLLEIGSVLGHKSLKATMRYAHLVQARPVTGHAGLEAKLKGRP
jgi:integrase